MDRTKVKIEFKSTVCRTCLSSGYATTSLHEDCDGFTLRAMLEKIADVRIEEELPSPSVICRTCAEDLRAAIAFRRRAQLANQTLHQNANISNSAYDDHTLASLKWDNDDHTILLPSLDMRNRLEFIDENSDNDDESSAERNKTFVSTLSTNVSHSLRNKNTVKKSCNFTNCTASKSQHDFRKKTVNTRAKAKFDDIYSQNASDVSNTSLIDLVSETIDYDTSKTQTLQSSTNIDIHILDSTYPYISTKYVPNDYFESLSPPGSPRRVPSPLRGVPKPQPKKKPVETTFEETIDIIYDTSTLSIIEKNTSIDTTVNKTAVIDLVDSENEDLINLQHPTENGSTQVVKIDNEYSNETKCNFCNKVFENKILLDDHMKLHQHKCPYFKCGKTFKTKDLRMAHIKISHPNPLFMCLTCGKKFTTKQKVAKHMLLHRSYSEKEKTTQSPCKCPYPNCGGSTFLTEEQKLTHNLIIKCQKCGKKYRTSHQPSKAIQETNELRDHMGIKHTGKKPFKCGKCGKSFFSNVSMKLHEKTHQPAEIRPRPYACAVCSKSFYSKYHLQQHMQCHSEECNFVCAKCGCKFRLIASLLRHEKRVHAFQL